jgi:hypothetical protein
VGAARKEGEFSRETARDATYADRPDQNTAFGNTRWHQQEVKDPATGEMTTKWTQNQALSGDQQEIFDYQTQRNADMAYMAAGKGNQIQQEMSQPLDWQQFGDVVDFDPTANRQRAEDDAYGRSTQRLDSQFDSDRVKLERQMSERGLRVGDSAFDSAMTNFNTGRNDAYEMARMGATAEGREEVGVNLSTNERANALRQQQIDEYINKRGQGLKEANALSGSMNTAEMSSTYGGGGE